MALSDHPAAGTVQQLGALKLAQRLFNILTCWWVLHGNTRTACTAHVSPVMVDCCLYFSPSIWALNGATVTSSSTSTLVGFKHVQ
jgi:hypothetical protein